MSEEGSHDPLTCPIVPGQETSILIEKGRTGLGLSIVGGADTLLVSCSILSLILCGNEKSGSPEWYFYMGENFPDYSRIQGFEALCRF